MKMKLRNLALIPARGGSKRIPRKNIRDFFGRPIISYSIEAAIKTFLFDEIIVSTDDLEIKSIATSYGAKVPFLRSAKNSNDYATIRDVLLEVIHEYEKINVYFDYVCVIYPTAVLITPEKLNSAYNLMMEKRAKGIVSIMRFNYPIQRALRMKENANIEFVYPEYLDKRSQDLDIFYHDAGQFFWRDVKAFIDEKQLFGEKVLGYELKEMEAHDIDTEEDWQILKIKYLIMKGKIKLD
jgi:N-acylneuraminate cytidylyltransferase